MPHPDIRFVIAGTGTIAPVHAEAIRRVRGTALAAIFGSGPERLETLGRRFGVPVYDDWDRLCQSERFDAVIVASHSGRHGSLGMQAALSGKHLLVEKPVATVLEEGERLVAFCEKAGIHLGVVYQHRFDPDLRRVRQWIQQGELGDILWVSAASITPRASSYYGRHAGRSDPVLTGGGVLINQGIHLVDILQWLLGPVSVVYGRTENRCHRLPFEDTAVGVLQFARGTVGTIVATTACRFPQPSRLEIHGTLGSVVMENFRLKSDLQRGRPAGKTQRMGQGLRGFFQKQGTHEDVLRDFVAALEKGHPPCVDGREALKSLEVVSGLYQANRLGRPVAIGKGKAVVALEEILK